MVYRGLPSKGCQACRKRRIKCDQNQPGCSQCMKICIQCPGYRNYTDLRFADETNDVIRRARGDPKDSSTAQEDISTAIAGATKCGQVVVISLQRGPTPRSSTKVAPRQDRLREADLQDSLIPQSPLLPLEDAAVSFLLSSYIKGGHFEYLPGLYAEARKDEPMTVCVQAVGLASLSRDSAHPEMLVSARKAYASALGLVSKALVSPTEAIKDNTLVSVMLLSLFETIASTGHRSYQNWFEHLNGATALLRLRGREQFKSRIGRHIFNQFGANIRVSCVQRKIHVPVDLTAMQCDAKSDLAISGDDPSLRFAKIVEDYANFRASLVKGTFSQPQDIIQAATYIDRQALSLISTMPSDWKFTIKHLDDDDPATYGTHYHIYPDHRVAQLWNSIRMIRILLNELIHYQITIICAKDSLTSLTVYAELLRSSCTTTRTTALDICASVPQFTSLPSEHPAAHGYFLIWPLSMAGGSRLVSASLRAYAIDRLRFIGDAMRIPQAREIAGMLDRDEMSVLDGFDKRREIDNWGHMYHLF